MVMEYLHLEDLDDYSRVLATGVLNPDDDGDGPNFLDGR
jgi:hypothetical protein